MLMLFFATDQDLSCVVCTYVLDRAVWPYDLYHAVMTADQLTRSVVAGCCMCVPRPLCKQTGQNLFHPVAIICMYMSRCLRCFNRSLVNKDFTVCIYAASRTIAADQYLFPRIAGIGMCMSLICNLSADQVGILIALIGVLMQTHHRPLTDEAAVCIIAGRIMLMKRRF